MKFSLTLMTFLLSSFVFCQEADSVQTEIEESVIIEESPEYPGGIQMFYNHLAQKLHYPSEARKKGIEGKVYVEFIVTEDGSIEDPRIAKGAGYGLDEEALRVIQVMPEKFIPGKQNGKPVKVKMVIPVYFKLANKVRKKNKFMGN